MVPPWQELQAHRKIGLELTNWRHSLKKNWMQFNKDKWKFCIAWWGISSARKDLPKWILSWHTVIQVLVVQKDIILNYF